MAEIHSEKSLEDVFSDLKIDKKEEKDVFQSLLEGSSDNFILCQKRNKKILSLGKENKKLEKLEKQLKKAKETYSEISETNIFRFLSGLRNSETKNKLEKEILLNLTHKNIIIHSQHIKNILEVLENSAKQAQKEVKLFSRTSKTNEALFWLWGFSDELEKYIKISEGRYDEKLQKYDSPAMRVLNKLAEPLGISNSTLAEAVKIYRQKKEENQDLEEVF